MNILENDRPGEFPPIEEEMMGRTWQEIEVLTQSYINRGLTIVGERRDDDEFSPVERNQLERLIARVHSLRKYGDKLHTIEILKNPDADEADRNFAKYVIWRTGVEQRMAGSLPTDPNERAKIIDQFGNEQRRQPAWEEVEQYMDWMLINRDRVIRQILKESPDPSGKIFLPEELGPGQDIE